MKVLSILSILLCANLASSAQVITPEVEFLLTQNAPNVEPYLQGFISVGTDYGPNVQTISATGRHGVIRYFSRDGQVIDTIHTLADGIRSERHLTAVQVRDSVITIALSTFNLQTRYFGRLDINVANRQVKFDTFWPPNLNPNSDNFYPLFGFHSEIHEDTLMVSSIGFTPNPEFNEDAVMYAVRSYGDTAIHIVKRKRNRPARLFDYYEYLPLRNQYFVLAEGFWWLWDKDLNMVSPGYTSYEQDISPDDPYENTLLSPTNGRFEIVGNTAYITGYSSTRRLGYLQPVLLVEKWDIDAGELIVRNDMAVDTFDYPSGLFTTEITPGTSNDAIKYDGQGHLYVLGHKPGGSTGNRIYVVKADTNLNVIWRRLFYTDDIVMAREIVFHPDDPDGIYFTGVRTVSQFNEDPYGEGQLRIYRMNTEGELSSASAGPLLENAMLVYPNPASSSIRVTESYQKGIARLDLYPITGGRVESIYPQNGEAWIDHLPGGVYLVAAYDHLGNGVAQQRLVIVR